MKVKPTNQLYKALHADDQPDEEDTHQDLEGRPKIAVVKKKSLRREHMVDLDPRMNETRIEPGEEHRPLPLCDEEHATHKETSLKPDDNKLVSQTLIDNVDLFA